MSGTVGSYGHSRKKIPAAPILTQIIAPLTSSSFNACLSHIIVIRESTPNRLLIPRIISVKAFSRPGDANLGPCPQECAAGSYSQFERAGATPKTRKRITHENS